MILNRIKTRIKMIMNDDFKSNKNANKNDALNANKDDFKSNKNANKNDNE